LGLMLTAPNPKTLQAAPEQDQQGNLNCKLQKVSTHLRGELTESANETGTEWPWHAPAQALQAQLAGPVE